ncbi:uncharacterized protein V6R79_001147 [Siganus canaliculatus]
MSAKGHPEIFSLEDVASALIRPERAPGDSPPPSSSHLFVIIRRSPQSSSPRTAERGTRAAPSAAA